MVQNSLGRLFIDKRKNEGIFADGRGLDEMTWDEAEEKRIAAEKYLAEQMEWKYYLPEAAQTKEVREQLDKIQQQSCLLYTSHPVPRRIDGHYGGGHQECPASVHSQYGVLRHRHCGAVLHYRRRCV